MPRPRKVNQKTIDKIRKLHATGKYSYADLAEATGTSIMIARYWATDRIQKKTKETVSKYQANNKDSIREYMKEYHLKKKVLGHVVPVSKSVARRIKAYGKTN